MYLTIKEVASTLRVSTVTVNRYINSGAIPAIKVGCTRRIDSVDFDKFLAESKESKEEA